MHFQKLQEQLAELQKHPQEIQKRPQDRKPNLRNAHGSPGSAPGSPGNAPGGSGSAPGSPEKGLGGLQIVPKSVRIFEGPLVHANTYAEAKIKAKKMNKDLVVVGEYIMADKIMFADELGTL